MPVFTIQTPDGRKVKIEAADEGAAMRGAEDFVSQNPKSAAPDRKRYGNPVLDFMAGENHKRQVGYAESDQRRAQNQGQPIWQPIRDAAAPITAAGTGLKSYYEAQSKPGTGLLSSFAGAGQLSGLLAQAVFAPVAAVTNQVVNPLARTGERLGIEDAESNANTLNLALAGARVTPRLPPPSGAPPPRVRPTPAARALARRAPEVPQMRAEAAAMRNAGVQPTLTDVSGSQGQRFVRAIGGKNDVAGEVLERRAVQARSNTKPAAIAGTRRLTPDQRTPSQLEADLRAQRGAQAQTDYAPIYAQQIPVTAAAAEALASETGQTALRLASRSARDLPDGAPVVAEINATLEAVRAGQPLPSTLSGRTLDYVYQVFGDIGRGHSANPRMGKAAAGAFSRQSQVQDALDAAPQLRPAREAYRNRSQAIDVAAGRNVPDPFTTAPQDYANWLQSLPAEAQAANQVAVRQYLQDWLGGQRQGPLGSLDEITTSPYGTANLRAVFGQQAQPYLDGLDALVRQQRNAVGVAPSAGSRTAILEHDMQGAQNVVDAARVGASALRLDPVGTAQGIINWTRRLGISDDLATEIATLSTDPARLNEALDLIEAVRGPGARNQLDMLVRQIGAGARDGATAIGVAAANQPE